MGGMPLEAHAALSRPVPQAADPTAPVAPVPPTPIDLEALADSVQRDLGLRVRPASVAFFAYRDGKSTVRLDGGALRFKLSDRLRIAPLQVVRGVLMVLTCKIERLPASRADAAAVRAYKVFVDQAQAIRAADPARPKGRKHIDPVGRHRSLLESYLRVSLDMGLTLPEIPKLSWSMTVSRHRFGHWDPQHSAIVISQVLDDPRVPEFVLDYVLYHELLHVIHPVRMGSGTKRRVHPPEFKRDERKFPRWKEGEEWIAKLAGRRWKPLG